MSPPGKEGQGFMEGVVYSALGRASRSVKVGPARGLDNGVVSLGGGRVMIVTVDPVSAIPAFGMKLSAWLSVHLIASDMTASGVDPDYAIFSYNFPPQTSRSQRGVFVREIGSACKELGIAIIAGHTGSYPGGGYTVIGSGAMLGFASAQGYVTPSMARVGDVILMTKHAAIEATGSLALSFPRFVAEKVGSRVAGRARAMIRSCSTVKDARAARGAELGKKGVTSMHDATEGGILGALDEMASASGKQFAVDVKKIPVSPEARVVCAAFEIDPLSTMGEGALLITCRPSKVEDVKRELKKKGVKATLIGEVKEGRGLKVLGESGRPSRYVGGPDLYWSAYEAATRRGLR